MGSNDPSDLLTIYTGKVDDCCEERTPIAGRYALTERGLNFVPAFGFDFGQEYVARISSDAVAVDLVPFSLTQLSVSVPAAVTAIYPSGETLPENTLRFYIHFAVPMQPQVAFDYIELRDASGTPDDAAFMRFKQELWNADRTRLTVLMDPGRIKREVATNVALGPALLAGEEYSLTVRAGWPSADGGSRLSEFTKTFGVSEALRSRPDVDHWHTSSPCVGTKTPLEVWFDRPFDRHGLSNHIRVMGLDGSRVNGTALVGADERVWRFFPEELWEQESIQIVADESLEDVAGNNLLELLDHAQGTDFIVDASTALSVQLLACP